jgi:hypothetical protein
MLDARATIAPGLQPQQLPRMCTYTCMTLHEPRQDALAPGWGIFCGYLGGRNPIGWGSTQWNIKLDSFIGAADEVSRVCAACS